MNPIIDNIIKCTKCLKGYLPTDFIGDSGQKTKQCKKCRDVGKNVNRNMETRLAQERIRDAKRRAAKKAANVAEHK
jgi:hypothetical protein